MASLLQPLGELKGLSEFMSIRWLEAYDLETLKGRKGTFEQKPEWEPSWAAAEGWYYTGHENCIQCISCGGQLRMPLTELDLRNYHCVFFPWCDLLSERLVQHERLQAIKLTNKLWNSVGHTIEYPLANPNEPRMKSESCRYRTLANPSNSRRSKTFAKVGLYDNGNAKSLRCYYCGKEVAKSELNENAMLAHARRSPECEHMKRVLGHQVMKEIEEFYGQVDDIQCDVTDQVPAHALGRHNSVLS